ncbi:formylglycine-generating enzyme family protein [bacterium]|nr:formylglycine-generating enzyme family protein [bacterium]
MRRFFPAFMMILIVLFLSCSKKSPLKSTETDEQYGSVSIKLVFPDEHAAKAASTEEKTTHALVFVYDSFHSLIGGEVFSYDGIQISKTFRIRAQSGITVKVMGFDNIWSISYMGKTPGITVVPDQTTSVTVAMKKHGYVAVPAGSFQMGSDSGETDEKPVHTVTLDAFIIGTTEVTQVQWKNIMLTNPSRFNLDMTCPVDSISWEDALKFCNQVSIIAGLEPCYDEESWNCDYTRNGYRLPTEAEWEYACRAGTITSYNTGDTEQDLDNAGWYTLNCRVSTWPVAGKEPNAWGLYDMHGNVSEFCYDIYSDTYYGSSPGVNPTGPETRRRSTIVRGGNWMSDAYTCRSSARSRCNEGAKSSGIGLRIVRNGNL